MTDTSKQWIKDAAAAWNQFEVSRIYVRDGKNVYREVPPKEVFLAGYVAALARAEQSTETPPSTEHICWAFCLICGKHLDNLAEAPRPSESTETPALRWNQIPGLTQEQNDWLDDLAHGLVTKEALKWVVGMAKELTIFPIDKEMK